MFCSKCGKEIKEEDKVCPECGVKTDSVVDLDAVKSFANEKLRETKNNIQGAAKDYSSKQQEQKEERKISSIHDIFVQESEREIAVIGGEYLSNLIHNGSLSKGFGVLTDRRFYFRGKCFYKIGKQYLKKDEERIVDLQDITCTGFIYQNYLLLRLLSIAGAISGVLAFCTISEGGFASIVISLLIFGVSALIELAYRFFSRAYYEVSFAGGCIAIKASSYGMKAMKKFNKGGRKFFCVYGN